MVSHCLWASLRRDEGGNGVRTDVPDFDPQMKIVVWDGQKYSEINPEVEGRRFGVDMGDYVAQAE